MESINSIRFGKVAQFVLLAFAVLFSVNVFGQLDVKHYIPPMHARTLAGTHYLVLGTPVSTPFNVTVTDGAGNLITTISISSSASSTTVIGSSYTSPFLVNYSSLNTVVSAGKGLILSASQPFYANIRVTVENQAESLTSKGSNASKGRDFRTGHMYNNSASGSEKSNCFSFMATEDNTQVLISEIKSGVVLEGVSAGTTSISVNLNEGQSYVVSNYMDNASASNNMNGLNGTHITSNKDIVVNCGTWLGGNALTGSSPNGAYEGGKDIGLDQIVPVENVGTEYVLIKGFGIDNERTVVVASEDNTQIFLNGSNSPSGTINAGDYYVIYGTSFSSQNNLYLRTSAPVFVTQSINGLSGTVSDNEHCAAMNFIPPVLCSGSKEVTIPNVQFLGTAYIQIIANTGAVIQVNGSVIGGASVVSGTSDYVTYSLSGYSGDVRVVSSLPIRVALINVSGNVGAAGYFSGFSKEINISAEYESNGVIGANEILEGCGTATVTIERLPYFASEAVNLSLLISGTATQGLDFSSIPSNLTMAAGQTSISFTINALADELVEGDETIIISLSVNGYDCGDKDLIFKIKDVAVIAIDLDNLHRLCLGDSILLDPIVTGGYEPYLFLWSTGETTQQITVNPTESKVYQFMVTDLCLVDTAYAETYIQLPESELNTLATGDTSVLCPYTPLQFSTATNGGFEAYSYVWTVNDVVVGNASILNYSPAATTDLIVKVTDFCDNEVQDTVHATIITPLMQIEVNEDRQICPFDETELWVNVTGGLAPFTYFWEHSAETTAHVIVNPELSTSYLVTVSDACALYELEGTPFVEVLQPVADFEILSNTQVENLPIYFENLSVGATEWDWELGNGDYSNLFSPGTTYLSDGIYTVTLIATNAIGCKDTVTKNIVVKPEFWFYAPNTFTPDGNEFNTTYKVSVIGAISMEFAIYNRWGEMVFQSFDTSFEWDGTYNGQMSQDGVFTYVAVVVSEDNESHKFVGHINLIK